MTYRQAVLRHAARLAAGCLLMGLLPALADVQVIPQVADGGGWSTTIVLSNKTSTAQNVTLSFHRAIPETNGTTELWTPPFIESVALPTISLAAGSSLFLHTPGTANTLSQGWGELNAAAGVSGYAIFTAQGQDATAPAVSAASRILVPFDNTSDLVTAVAVANPNASAETIQVNIKTSDGAVSTGALPEMPALGHRAFVLPDLFPATKGKRGLAEFYIASGSFSIIALRFNPTSAFTSAPVYSQTGASIIGATVTNAPATAPRTQVIPQVADGSNWSTTIVLTNTTTANLTGALTFRTSIAGGGGSTAAWNLAFLENASTSSFTIPAGSTMFLQTPGTAEGLSQGYAALTADAGVEGYAIFTSRAGGKAQDGTASAVSGSSRLLVPFDNASGLVTALAIVNPNDGAESVSVNLRTADGATSVGAGINLPAQGHIAVVMPELFPGTAGKRGLAELYVSSGTIAFIALRFSGSGAFASAPAYFESGTPVISTGGGGGGNSGGSSDMNPTPAEIESWIARGYYTSGALTLTRATAYATTDTIGAGGVTAVTALTKADSFSAQFSRFGGADLGKILRGELPPGYPNLNPAAGSCVVYTISSQTNPYPNITSVGLDAGPQVTSSGPNGNQAALRQTHQVSGFTYNASNVPNTYLAAGQYSLAGPGGADVGSFTGTLNIVPDLVVTNNPDDLKVINRSSGVTLRWTGGESSTFLTITGSSVASLTDGAAFVCIQNTSAGQFTVPSSVLAQLPASAVIGAGGFNFVTRGTISVTAAGKGARFASPSGLDILTANNYWSWSYTPQYQ
ncbi:hypothetical protein [uncultured Paludibaculum sp.]|uniref:hypothetical protein n=1 Tax=uncultured Paludibaculum sp. TaxID=1765020 RepID=UPI002AAC2CE4|nr:hypothetical protein [uncultured Paludibaculum sp.]